VISLAFLTVFSSPLQPQITEIEINLTCLPPEFDGITCVQISDIHLGPFAGINFMEDVIKTVINLKPSLVFITGGLIGMPHTKTGVKMLAPFDALLDYFTELNSNNNNSKSQEPQLIKGGSYYVTGYGEYLGGNVEYWFMELNEKK